MAAGLHSDLTAELAQDLKSISGKILRVTSVETYRRIIRSTDLQYIPMGNVSTQTMKGFTLDEFKKMISEMS